jgi:hypothetical protein
MVGSLSLGQLLRAQPEVRRHRRCVLAVHDPVAVDILWAAVAGTEVVENLTQIVLVHDAVAVDVPDTG